jgi:hypothetical protein
MPGYLINSPKFIFIYTNISFILKSNLLTISLFRNKANYDLKINFFYMENF